MGTLACLLLRRPWHQMASQVGLGRRVQEGRVWLPRVRGWGGAEPEREPRRGAERGLVLFSPPPPAEETLGGDVLGAWNSAEEPGKASHRVCQARAASDGRTGCGEGVCKTQRRSLFWLERQHTWDTGKGVESWRVVCLCAPGGKKNLIASTLGGHRTGRRASLGGCVCVLWGGGGKTLCVHQEGRKG